MSDGNIQAARIKLARAVQKLCSPKPFPHGRDTLYAPSLYDTLKSDLAGTQGDNKAAAKSLPPVWIDALQLMFDMDSQTHRWIPLPGSTPQRLQLLTQKTFRPQDTDEVTGMARTVGQWCDRILALVEPESVKFIFGTPCPRCQKLTVYRRDSAGEVVRQPALRLIANVGCTCQNCQAHWPPEKYLFLQTLLGLEPTEGVIA